MRRSVLHSDRLALPTLCAAAIAILILAGAVVWFRPFLTRVRQSTAEVPSPAALLSVGEFAVKPHHQACESSVAITPNSRLAQFQLRPSSASSHGGPPVELVLSGTGYRTTAHISGGYLGGGVTLPIASPAHALIGSACFVNKGRTTVLFDGTTEPRTISRSATFIDGKTVVGDIALTFLDNNQRSLVDALNEVFSHASNLTERLIPIWLIWLLAVLVAFGIPLGIVAAFYLASREDQAAA